jgi:hypothetical protein
MLEQSSLPFREVDPLTPQQAKAVRELRILADEHEPVCRQAPVLWDAESSSDTVYAKQQCLGLNDQGKQVRPECPILKECLQTALILETRFGVWGGKAPYERRKIVYSSE